MIDNGRARGDNEHSPTSRPHMSTRNIVLAATLAASLIGCVERGDWKPAPRLEPSSLAAQQTLAGARLDAAAWPADQWWRGYGDPQLDALIAEALAGRPSLEIAAGRLAGLAARCRPPLTAAAALAVCGADDGVPALGVSR